jgi:hypothetical protein
LIECETPDFLVVTATGRKIGIEHTQVFKKGGADQTAEQADEATKELIMIAARLHAECLNLPPACVSLYFNPQYLRQSQKPKKNRTTAEQRFLTKAERQNIARHIAEFVGNNMPADGCSVELEPRPNSGQPREVDLIRINRSHSVRHRWDLGLEFLTPQHDAIERLQEEIDKKNKKYAECRLKCDECWLLVVASSQSSGNIHPDEKSLTHLYASEFDRTYFLDFGFGGVVPLNATQG